MLKDLDLPEEEQSGGFLIRDLVRFFIVDVILIITVKLLVGLGVITHPDAHVLFILSGKVILLVYLLWLVKERRDAWKETGATSAGKWWAWPACLGLYAASYPVILYVDKINRVVMETVHGWFGLVYRPHPQDVIILIFENILSSPVRIVLIVFVVLIGPMMEELAFRGMGMDAYKRRHSVFYALVMTSVLFGAYHFSLQLLIPLSCLGLVFGIARIISHTLWTSIFIHCLHNFLTLVIMAYELGILDKFLAA